MNVIEIDIRLGVGRPVQILIEDNCSLLTVVLISFKSLMTDGNVRAIGSYETLQQDERGEQSVRLTSFSSPKGSFLMICGTSPRPPHP